MTSTKTRTIKIGPLNLGGGAPLVLIAGPCVIESEDLVMRTAEHIARITDRLGLAWVLKASFDKANRSSVSGFRGPGLELGLAILARAKAKFGVPVLSDIHGPEQAQPAAQVLDIIQIPAFLCRQTDLLAAAGATQKPVNIKKGQFMAPAEIEETAKKVESAGNPNVIITERGTTFGYNNLVVDMRSLGLIRELGYPVVFDATHSVQLPAAKGASSGGDRKFVPLLARAATAAGIDALFLEVHPDPDHALCDGPNSWPLDQLEPLLQAIIAIDQLSKRD